MSLNRLVGYERRMAALWDDIAHASRVALVLLTVIFAAPSRAQDNCEIRLTRPKRQPKLTAAWLQACMFASQTVGVFLANLCNAGSSSIKGDPWLTHYQPQHRVYFERRNPSHLQRHIQTRGR